MRAVVRAVHEKDWRRARDLRLAALRDPAAPTAFVGTFEEESALPDVFWQDRAAKVAAGRAAREFMAEEPTGRWLGTVSVLVEIADAPEDPGTAAALSQAQIAGVYVRPEARGTGLAVGLLRAAMGVGVARSPHRADPAVRS